MHEAIGNCMHQRLDAWDSPHAGHQRVKRPCQLDRGMRLRVRLEGPESVPCRLDVVHLECNGGTEHQGQITDVLDSIRASKDL